MFYDECMKSVMAMLDHVRSWLYVGLIKVFWDFVGLMGLYGFKSIGSTASVVANLLEFL